MVRMCTYQGGGLWEEKRQGKGRCKEQERKNVFALVSGYRAMYMYIYMHINNRTTAQCSSSFLGRVMRCVTREPIATTSLPRELMTQKRWVDVEDFATDSEREAIDGDEPEPEIGWRASLDVWPQLCSRTPVVQVIDCL